MPTLLINGQLILERNRRVARLRWDMGDAYEASVLVGNSAGDVNTYRLNFGVLPDRSSDSRFTIADDEDSNIVKTWRDYLEAFWLRRMVDGASFSATDQTNGATLTVVLADNNFNIKATGKDIYAAEFRVRQYRAPA